jgi:hypothetical protein
LDVIQTIRELIDLRSFSNLWYWIALAVTWSTASHWILGVPIDMVHRARKHGGQPAQDLEDIARVHVNRRLYILRVSGVWVLGFACFSLSGLAVLGFGFGIEFAQAVFLLAFPLSLVSLITLNTARKIERDESRGEALYKRLTACRFQIQLVGMLSIFVTALWGMYQNLSIGALG